MHQDPTDEPASVLFERIRAEQAAIGKAGRRERGAVQRSLFGTSVQQGTPSPLPPGADGPG